MNRRDIKQTESEFLEAQQMEARAALRRTMSELKGACAQAAHPRFLVEHPVATAGIALTAVGALGFLIHKLRRKQKAQPPTIILQTATPAIGVEIESGKKKVSKGKTVVVLAALGKWAGPLLFKTLMAQRFGRIANSDEGEDEEAEIDLGGTSRP